MDSKQICKRLGRELPESGWQRISRGGSLISPAGSGVYVFRTVGGVPFGRFRGESDVVYIGQGALSGRSRQHGTVRLNLRDKGWLIALLNAYRELEIGFFSCTEPVAVERDLVQGYFKNHLELPPANRRLEGTEVHKKELGLEALARKFHADGITPEVLVPLMFKE